MNQFLRHKKFEMTHISKTVVFIALLAQCALLAQNKVKTFEIVSQESRRGSSVLPDLQSFDGSSIGKISNEATDSTCHYRVEVEGKSPVRIEALSNIVYCPNADKFWVFGNSPFRHIESEMALKLYDGNGTLQKNWGLVAYFPFITTTDAAGNFYVAGKTEYEKAVFACKKFDSNGQLVWQKSLPFGLPNAISVSESGQRVAVAVTDEKSRKTNIYCLDAAGTTLGQNSDFGMIDRLAFAGDDKMVVCTGRQFYLYKNNGQTAYAVAQLPGYAIGQAPISASPDGQHILVVSTDSPDTQNGFRVLAYDQNAVLTHDAFFEGEATDDLGKLVRFENQETLRLALPNALFTLKMKN